VRAWVDFLRARRTGNGGAQAEIGRNGQWRAVDNGEFVRRAAAEAQIFADAAACRQREDG
jgi:hypothetical protein